MKKLVKFLGGIIATAMTIVLATILTLVCYFGWEEASYRIHVKMLEIQRQHQVEQVEAYGLMVKDIVIETWDQVTQSWD